MLGEDCRRECVAWTSEGVQLWTTRPQCEHCGMKTAPGRCGSALEGTVFHRHELEPKASVAQNLDSTVRSPIGRPQVATHDRSSRTTTSPSWGDTSGAMDQDRVADPSCGTEGARDTRTIQDGRHAFAGDGEGDQQSLSEEVPSPGFPDDKVTGCPDGKRDHLGPEGQGDDDGLPSDGAMLEGPLLKDPQYASWARTISDEEETCPKLRPWVQWLQKVPDVDMVLKVKTKQLESKESKIVAKDGDPVASSSTTATLEMLTKAVTELTQEVAKVRADQEASQGPRKTRITGQDKD